MHFFLKKAEKSQKRPFKYDSDKQILPHFSKIFIFSSFFTFYHFFEKSSKFSEKKNTKKTQKMTKKGLKKTQK